MKYHHLIFSVFFVYLFLVNIHAIICQAAYGVNLALNCILSLPITGTMAIWNARDYDDR